MLAVGGPSDLASLLRQQLLRGRADPGAVRIGGPDGADVYVHVLKGAPGEEDEDALRRARRACVPAIAVAVGAPRAPIPYVLATDALWVAAGRELPVDAVARAVAARLGEEGAPLAARVPVLREPVCEHLVSSIARKNGLLGAATWIPGPDLPALLLNEVRLVLRLAQAHGAAAGRERLPELAATFGTAFGLRAVARVLRDAVPAGAWVLRGGVAYSGTRALGEAVRRRFAVGSTPRPVGGAPSAP